MTVTASRFYALSASATDPQTEAAFFDPLKMKNGTFKRTCPSRFSEIEEAFAPIFKERADAIRSALDIGVSSGVTSLDLMRFLSLQGASPSLTATDLFLQAHIVDLAPGLRALTDPEGFPLQYDVAGMAIRPWIRRLDYATLAFAPRLLARLAVRALARRMIALGQSRPVRLASPRLASRGDIELVEDNILTRRPSFVGRFDFVRAANILNLGYFSAVELDLGIRNIQSYMRGAGSLLLVTRTQGAAANAATLFEYGSDRTFHVLERVGGGSEIEASVLATTAHGQAPRP